MVGVENWPGRRAVYIPPRSKKVSGLLLELHGSGLDPIRQYQVSRLADQVGKLGIATILPEAATTFQLTPEVPEGFAWNVPGVPLPGADGRELKVDDIGYIIDLIRSLETQAGSTFAPLFIAGYSGGARLASHLLTTVDVEWTAAGLVAGLRSVEKPLHAPADTISFHGRDDTLNPYVGGAGPRWDLGVEEAAAKFAAAGGNHFQCVEAPVRGATVRTYRSRDGRNRLTTYCVDAASHAWPGARDENHLATFGPAGQGVSATELIAAFFAERMEGTDRAHPRRHSQGIRH